MNSQDRTSFPTKPRTFSSSTFLTITARFWFVVAVLGQWIFIYYVAAFYGSLAFLGDFEGWNDGLPHGYVEGDGMGNLAVGLHLLFAVLIFVSGPLQLIPYIRKRFPVFHRWNGRVFLTTAFATSLVGLFMVWTRGTVGGPAQYIGISLDAILIIVFGGLTLRFALARDFSRHERWALRLFIVVSAVWFYRIMLMLWLVLNGGPVGFDMETFRGPFLAFLAFGQYMLPLAFLELYFLADRKKSPIGKIVMGIVIVILTGLMGLGIFAATMGMWLPML